MGQYDDRSAAGAFGQFARQPSALTLADGDLGIRYVVQRDEGYALVFEGVKAGAEEFVKRLALVQRGVVLAGQEPDLLDRQTAGDFAKLLHAPAPLGAVLRGLGQVARKDHKVRRLRQVIHRLDGADKGGAIMRVDGRIAKAPVAVGELDEEEILAVRFIAPVKGARRRDTIGVLQQAQAGNEYGAPDSGQFEESASVDMLFHASDCPFR